MPSWDSDNTPFISDYHEVKVHTMLDYIDTKRRGTPEKPTELQHLRLRENRLHHMNSRMKADQHSEIEHQRKHWKMMDNQHTKR